MMFLFTFVALVLSLVFWYHRKFGHRNNLIAKIPAPKRWPLIHHVPQFLGKSPLELFDYFEETKNKLGQIFILTFDPFDDGAIIVSDPKVAEAVLTSSKHLKKSNDYEMMKNWLGDGLLLSIGDKWRQRRKILTPAFHFQILEKFVDVMNDHGNILIEKLEKFNGREVDVHPLLNLYALDVICESAMGCRIDAQKHDSDYVKAVNEIAVLIFKRANDPIRRFNFVYQFTEMCQREKNLLKILHSFTDKVIAMRKEELSKKSLEDLQENGVGIKKKLALLDLLLQVKVGEVQLSDSDIREEVDTFMFGGHDTTTSGSSFVLYCLATHPEFQQKVFEEIEDIFGSDQSRVVSMQDLNKLNYLDLVIKESLRIYPSVPYIGRVLSEEMTAGGFTFPKNSNIMISAFLMGRDSTIFPNPLIFDPLRFDVETTTEKINSFAYIPFSAGQRNCLGQRFAVMEMKSIISKIIHNFEVSISKDNEKLELHSEMVLKSANGIILSFRKR